MNLECLVCQFLKYLQYVDFIKPVIYLFILNLTRGYIFSFCYIQICQALSLVLRKRYQKRHAFYSERLFSLVRKTDKRKSSITVCAILQVFREHREMTS